MMIPPSPRPLEWAVLIYSSASPDIEQAAVRSLDEVAAAPAPDSVAVGVQLGTRREVVRYSPTHPLGKEPVPVADMADKDALADFLAWGMRAFPARHYMVVLGGHGSGFLGAVTDPGRTHMIPPDDMVKALDGAPARTDVLVMNACLMAQAEVATEMAGHADYLVASQGMEEKEGLPLGRLLPRLAGASPREAGRALVEEAGRVPDRTPFVSLLDLSRSEPVVRALDGLGAAMLANPDAVPALREHVAALPTFRTGNRYDPPLSDYKDLVSLARRIEADPRLARTDLPRAAEEARCSVEALVIAHTPGPEASPAQGLSVYAPLTPLEEAAGPLGARAWEIYLRQDLARSTRWDEAIALLAGVPSHPPES